MNLDKLNQWLTLLGNLGVVVGLIFLVIEVQQNSQLMQAQTRDSVTEKTLSFYESIYGATDTFENWESIRNRSEIAQPVSGEEMRFSQIALANFRLWENEWYQFQIGLFDINEFEPRYVMWSRLLRSPAYRSLWDQMKASFAPEFRNKIDSIISEIEAANQ